MTQALNKTLAAPNLPSNLTHRAQWLSGEGAGSWFDITEERPGVFRMKRYSDIGEIECNSLFTCTSKLDLSRQYQITYPSHCARVSLIQSGQKIHLDLLF